RAAEADARLTQRRDAHPWSDFAVIVHGRVLRSQGHARRAAAIEGDLRARLAAGAPPRYRYRRRQRHHELIHVVSAAERALLDGVDDPGTSRSGAG
ncbi:MAG: hypothetical protein AAF772_19815, partial [Acidobacteriota bacterium]